MEGVGRPTELSEARQQEEERQFKILVDGIARTHVGGQFVPNPEQYWTPVTRPLQEMRIGLVTSIGAHLDDQEPFDILDPHGDPSFREIPADVESSRVRATHGHVDTDAANQDINCILPVDRLRELIVEGAVGGSSRVHIGFMGFCPDNRVMRDRTGPEIAGVLKEAGADAVVLTPG